MKTSLLIIGFGVVGKAVDYGLRGKNIEISLLDPPLGLGSANKHYNFDGIIITVPTPMGEDGKCDDSLVKSYIKEIRLNNTAIPILLKSTTSIETIKSLQHDPYITFNPEFLTASNADLEFMYQDFAIFGGNQGRFWYDIFVNNGIRIKNVRFTDMIKAAYAKYSINSFLATKVIFFNELRMMYGDYNFDMLTDLISLDSRIGKSHMMVPGPDGEMGFGGMCFPKDTSAFVETAKSNGTPLTLLEKVIEINTKLR